MSVSGLSSVFTLGSPAITFRCHGPDDEAVIFKFIENKCARFATPWWSWALSLSHSLTWFTWSWSVSPPSHSLTHTASSIKLYYHCLRVWMRIANVIYCQPRDGAEKKKNSVASWCGVNCTFVPHISSGRDHESGRCHAAAFVPRRLVTGISFCKSVEQSSSVYVRRLLQINQREEYSLTLRCACLSVMISIFFSTHPIVPSRVV